MTEISRSKNLLKTMLSPAGVFRVVTTTMILSTLVACATAPAKPAGSKTTTQAQSSKGMITAADMYNSRNYAGAIREFDNIITDKNESANSRRMAHLGKAMIYLGNDENWHSLENAKMSVIAAGQVAPPDNEEFAIETDMLMDAISAVIGTESKYAVMQGKSGASGAEIGQLKKEIVTLETERDDLLAEQKRLNDALQKLKELTLGN